jgi:hypothetical protein
MLERLPELNCKRLVDRFVLPIACGLAWKNIQVLNRHRPISTKD